MSWEGSLELESRSLCLTGGGGRAYEISHAHALRRAFTTLAGFRARLRLSTFFLFFDSLRGDSVTLDTHQVFLLPTGSYSTDTSVGEKAETLGHRLPCMCMNMFRGKKQDSL